MKNITEPNESNPEISVVMPCLNEEETIGACIKKAQQAISKHNLRAEIIIADNGSTDRSIEIAQDLEAKVVHQPLKGYGNAYHAGIAAAKGQYIVMGDSDNTYDFSEIERFVGPLRKGQDLVMGNRFAYKLEKEAMPFLHRYVGNPILSGILRTMFKVKVRDAHCGIRGFTRKAYDKLNLRTTGMEYASEMVIKAGKENLKITEIPIHYHIRKGESKLNTFSDGWRHLRFMLIYSPNYLFLIPGFLLFFFGLIFLIRMMFGPVKITEAITLDLHPMFFGSLLAILGYQIFSFGIFGKLYAYQKGLEKKGKVVNSFVKYFTLERAIYFGLLFLLAGLLITGWVIWKWQQAQFGELFEVRKILTAMTLISIGVQTIFSAFFFSILSIPTKSGK